MNVIIFFLISSLIFGFILMGETVSITVLLLVISIIAGIFLLSVNPVSSLLFGLSAIPSRYILSGQLSNPPTLLLLRNMLITVLGWWRFGLHWEEIKGNKKR